MDKHELAGALVKLAGELVSSEKKAFKMKPLQDNSPAAAVLYGLAHEAVSRWPKADVKEIQRVSVIDDSGKLELEVQYTDHSGRWMAAYVEFGKGFVKNPPEVVR